MDEKYYPEKIEEKWQQLWEERGAFEVEREQGREPFYALEMPLPFRLSAHGACRYSIGDALSWYKRLRGFNVLHPDGTASAGKPGSHQARRQPARLDGGEHQAHARPVEAHGRLYDWRREIAAHTPEYYQVGPVVLPEDVRARGVACKKMSPVNWCPTCQTTLSNEQSSGGVCWRCGNAVEKKEIAQWFPAAYPDYAEQLLEA